MTPLGNTNCSRSMCLRFYAVLFYTAITASQNSDLNLPLSFTMQVNPQRARLWQELTTDSVLFDVSLTGSDRDVHCNRCARKLLILNHERLGTLQVVYSSAAGHSVFSCWWARWVIHCCRFVLAEESCFFEKQFRRPEFARSDNVIDLRSIDGATLQVLYHRIQCPRPHGHCCSIRWWVPAARLTCGTRCAGSGGIAIHSTPGVGARFY